MKKRRLSITFVVMQSILFIAMVYFSVCILFNVGTEYYKASNYLNCITECFMLSLLVYLVIIFKFYPTKTLQIYYIIALMGHFIGGNLLNFYSYVSYYNSILHFVNSMFIGIIIYSLLSRHMQCKSWFIKIMIVTACVISIGVFWEFYEYFTDITWGTNMQRYRNSITGEPFVGISALKDTMSDLMLDTFGGFVSGLFCLVKIKGCYLYKFFDIRHELRAITSRDLSEKEIKDNENVDSAEEPLISLEIEEEKPNDEENENKEN